MEPAPTTPHGSPHGAAVTAPNRALILGMEPLDALSMVLGIVAITGWLPAVVGCFVLRRQAAKRLRAAGLRPSGWKRWAPTLIGFAFGVGINMWWNDGVFRVHLWM